MWHCTPVSTAIPLPRVSRTFRTCATATRTRTPSSTTLQTRLSAGGSMPRWRRDDSRHDVGRRPWLDLHVVVAEREHARDGGERVGDRRRRAQQEELVVDPDAS